MNQPTLKRMGNCIYIDIKDFVWKLIGQWKAVLAFLLIAILIFTGLSYISYVKTDDAGSSSVPQSQEEALGSLEGNARELVLSVYRMKETQNEISNYINGSAMMEVDTSNVSLLTLNWDVKGQSLTDGRVASAYSSEMISDTMINSIKEAWGDHYAEKQIDELIAVNGMTYDETEQNAESAEEVGHLGISIVIPNGVDGELTKDNVIKTMDDIYKKISDSVGDYTIKLVGSSLQPASNPLSIVEKQTNAYNRLYNISAQMSGVINGSFSDEQKAAYNRLIQYHENEGKNIETEDSAQNKTKFRISKKKLLLGMFASCVLYVLLYLAYCIASGRIHSASSLKEVSGIRNLGEWYSGSKHEGLVSKLTNSSAVYKRHHRSHLDENAELTKVTETVINASKHSGINKLLLTLNEGSDENCREFVNKLIARLNSAGIDLSVSETDIRKGLTVDEAALNESDGVIIAVDHKHSMINEIKDVCEKCTYYNVPILGTIYLG